MTTTIAGIRFRQRVRSRLLLETASDEVERAHYVIGTLLALMADGSWSDDKHLAVAATLERAAANVRQAGIEMSAHPCLEDGEA